MNPVGANSINNQLAQKQVQDQRLLAKDVAKGQVTTATTLGKTVNQPKQEIKPSVVETPKERVTLSTEEKAQPEVKDQSETAEAGANQQAAATEEAAQADTSKSAAALTTFTDSLFGLQDGNKKELEDIITQSAMVDTSALPAGESGREVALAATALRTALAQLQAKMPGATKEQIREAAKNDPEIAKWASIADSAGGYLSAIKSESPQASAQAAASLDPNAPGPGGPGPSAVGESAGPGGPGGPGPGGDNGANYRLGAEQQAQMMADNVKTMQAIQTIYTQMWAEIAKARAQRHQLVMETANAINAMVMETHVNRMKTSENHRKAIMSVILETGK